MPINTVLPVRAETPDWQRYIVEDQVVDDVAFTLRIEGAAGGVREVPYDDGTGPRQNCHS